MTPTRKATADAVRLARRRALILKRASSETFRGRAVHVVPVEPGLPFIVRAYYGPVSGNTASRIVVLRHREDYLTRRQDLPREERQRAKPVDQGDVVIERFDNPGGQGWGPREFIQEMLDCVAGVGGNAIILMVHSGQQVEVDPVAFQEWARRSQADPATALLEPARLLITGG